MSSRSVEPWEHHVELWQHLVEKPTSYQDGGLHPMKIKDKIGSKSEPERYRIVHKLGHGSYSTVWLAWDNTRKRNVALKVLMAKSENREVKFRQTMKHVRKSRQLAKKSQHPGEDFILQFFDDFKIEGPNGTHQCLVTEVVGPTIRQIKDSVPDKNLPVGTAKKFTKQFIYALDFLHSHEIWHGDLYPNNIATKFSKIVSMTDTDIYKEFGNPQMGKTKYISGGGGSGVKPKELVLPMRFGKPQLDEIRIIDFGEAMSTSDQRNELCTPLAYRAPECLIDGRVGPKADVFAFACTVFEFFSNSELLPGDGTNDANEYVAEMVAVLPEKFPTAWWAKWRKKQGFGDYFYHEGGRYEFLEGGWPHLLKERLPSMRHGLSKSELAGLEKLLTKCLKFEPQNRPNTKDLIELCGF